MSPYFWHLHSQILASTSVTYSWLLPISKFLITHLYSSSLPGRFPKVPSKGLGPCPGNQPREPSLRNPWQIFKSSLLCLAQMPELPATLSPVLLSTIFLTESDLALGKTESVLTQSLNLQPSTYIRCQLPYRRVYCQVIGPVMSVFCWKELMCYTKTQ